MRMNKKLHKHTHIRNWRWWRRITIENKATCSDLIKPSTELLALSLFIGRCRHSTCFRWLCTFVTLHVYISIKHCRFLALPSLWPPSLLWDWVCGLENLCHSVLNVRLKAKSDTNRMSRIHTDRVMANHELIFFLLHNEMCVHRSKDWLQT